MSNGYIKLNLISTGERCKVKKILSKGLIRRRLLDLGLIQDTLIYPLYKSPFGNPTAYLIRGTVIALRSEASSNILVEKL